MHILLLGATGPSGLVFLEEALRSGNEITIYARSPQKLPEDVRNNSQVHVVQGEFSDMDGVRTALGYGATVLVSFAGPALPNYKGTPITEFYQNLFPLLQTEGSIKHALVTSTGSYKAPEDRFSIKWFFGILAIRVVGGTAFREINGMSAAVTAVPTGTIEWTMFRLPLLTDGEAKPVQTGMIGSGKDGLFLTRRSGALWILNEIVEKKWVGKAPAISNPGWL